MRRAISTPPPTCAHNRDPANWDLAIVGGGFRTTTFLASAPELLNYRITIVERGNILGPGAFGEYTVSTSSAGLSRLKQLNYSAPFAVLRDNPQVASVAGCPKPVRTEMLASALRQVGFVIVDTLGVPAVRLHTSVSQIGMDSTAGPVTLRLEGGDIIRAGHVLLATGRRERPHPELEPWQNKTFLSSTVISMSGRKLLENALVASGQRPTIIAGCSHSAMSALQVLLEVTSHLERGRCPFVVLQRSPARLMYESQEQARAEQIPGREQLFDSNRDVCPVTGIVFRDSGLRHASKALYCDLWDGKIPGARFVRIGGLRDATDLFEDGGLIVQALGYHGEAPDIVVSGKLVRPSHSDERLLAAEDGAAIIGGRVYDNLSVLRVEPTPRDRRDNTAFGSDLYRHLAARLVHRMNALEETGESS